ncbi:crotonase/enoyl-CoA hydratase family protein [Blastococcus mobilis]|uniref:Enoyl-CoA hydratase n=1 Tax=Blastococcus mobilis TaxID=1938746 RepID=A0A238ZCH7_9ACTN|nr:crotonase/enoyl-CoA hydratase family protein [Blastococcus mobilis]SNR81215.1 Enoyl-CoA hydratase [Blastococcus mobilis]
MSVVQLDVNEGIATITLNRPELLNAFTDEMEVGLVEAFDRTDADDDVRAVILTGAGRGFCAGMDVSDGDAAFVNWRTSGTAPEGTTYEVPGESMPMRRDGGGRVVLRIYSSLKPVIAAVNGPATGVGATMLLPCDVRLASEDARFGFVFNRRGVVPESCSSWFLPRVVGMQTALEWVLTGRVFPATEALEQKLVRTLHAPGGLLDAARALAREIADNTAPVSASLARRMLWRMQEAAHPMTAHQVETLAINLRGVSADLQEGFTAFLEKRSPVFPDRVGTDLPDIFRSMPEPAFDPAVLKEYHREA